MTDVQHNTSHFANALLKLAPPFWGKPVIASIVWAFMKQVQELEDSVHLLIEGMHPDTADAERLRIIGERVGQPNPGVDTESYRLLVKARILANRSKSRRDDLLAVLDLLGETDATITPAYPAGIVVTLEDNPALASMIAEFMHDMSPVDVTVITASDTSAAFRFGSWNGASVTGGTDVGDAVDGSGAPLAWEVYAED